MADTWFIYQRSYGGFYHQMATNITSRSVSWTKTNGRSGRCDRNEVVFMADNERAVLDVLSQLEQSRHKMTQEKTTAEGMHTLRITKIVNDAVRQTRSATEER